MPSPRNSVSIKKIQETPKHFNIAIKNSAKSEHRFRVGATIIKGGAVISTGFNKSKGAFSFSVHAEVAALKRAKYPAGADIFVSRLLANGSCALAAPCGRCIRALKKSGIRRAFFSGYNGEWGFIKL